MVPSRDKMDLAAVRVLASAEHPDEFGGWLASNPGGTAEPFDAERIAILEGLSARILRHPRLRRDPSCASLGFWLRRSHLNALRATFERATTPNCIRVAAGMVF